MTELIPITKIFKKYRKRGIHNGMTLSQAFELELEVYQLLNNWNNFPKLISFDKINFTITIENCGQSLHKLRQINNSKIVIPNLEEQVSNICQGVRNNNITYLDLDPTNICLKENTLFLIDFDKVVINDLPKSKILEEMYIEFKKNVSDDSFKKTLKEFVTNFDWPRHQFVK